mmetsp:Transcript_6883/g.11716  ORF Transcript_6883/g.11716 Transcript_6883/m.11716 type:complete len:243 (+) Transcript_6883:382-1110(+)
MGNTPESDLYVYTKLFNTHASRLQEPAYWQHSLLHPDSLQSHRVAPCCWINRCTHLCPSPLSRHCYCNAAKRCSHGLQGSQRAKNASCQTCMPSATAVPVERCGCHGAEAMLRCLDHLGLGTSIINLLGSLLSLLLGHALLHNLGESGGEVLDLVHCDVGQATDDLVAGNLLVGRDFLKDEVEGGLLLHNCSSSCGCSRPSHLGSSHSRGCVHAEGLLNLGHQLAGLQEGQGLELVDNIRHC